MAEQTRSLTETIDAFEAVRGDVRDRIWASDVSWRLLSRDVHPEQALGALAEALDVARLTGSPPDRLFGPASEHSDALYDEWKSEGRLVLAPTEEQTWSQAVRFGLALSAVYVALFTLALLVRGDLDAGIDLVRVLLISLVVGLGSALALAAWGRRHRRKPRPDAPADARWSLELTDILRTRHSLSGARVRDIVAEANAHAAESGRPVEEEFGTPEEYAGRLAPDLRRRSRLRLTGLSVMALAAAVLMLDDPGWTSVGLTLIVGSWAADELRRYRGLRAQSGR